ncbi:MAG: flagellin [bacterium]
MGIVVNTNISSFLVQRSLSDATSEINKSIERLSTGYKINRAADDAAGLVISESLKSQSRGAAMAAQNAQTGMNLLQTAEADLGVILENLQRIRDLTVQAANGTNGSVERAAIKSEVDARFSEINRIAESSTFNAVKLLNGDNTTLTLQAGPNAVSSLNTLDIGAPLQSAKYSSLGISGVTTAFDSATAAASFITLIDTAINTVSTRRSTIGSLQNRLESAIRSLTIKQENMTAAESRIRDADIAKEAAALTKNQILQQASASLLAQANQAPTIALGLIG